LECDLVCPSLCVRFVLSKSLSFRLAISANILCFVRTFNHKRGAFCPADNDEREAVLITFAGAIASRPFDLEQVQAAAGRVKEKLGDGAFTEACATAGACELITKAVDVIGKQSWSVAFLILLSFVMMLMRWVASIVLFMAGLEKKL